MSRSTSWDAVLEKYARLKQPDKELPPSVLLLHDDKCMTIFDGYEKAKYHFLVLPRDPFILSTGSKIATQNLTSLQFLLSSKSCLQVLKALEFQSNQVCDMIKDEMKKTFNCVWDVQIGFHAIESMRHVHLHVVSNDFVSDRLKNKKHYNSFHPKLGFFLHLSDVIRDVENGIRNQRPTSYYESILKQPLVSHITNKEFPNIPKLKLHLQNEFERMIINAKSNGDQHVVAASRTNKIEDNHTNKRKESSPNRTEPEVEDARKRSKIESD
ncbi:aprataxin-like protein [Microbotryomycetes sp. JL221]|nr:aprataxin-like protein [Microbotryomycetes sp. JL221]